MMRVPVDATNPTFDHTFKVSAMKYFFGSTTAERKEWLRRRNAAAELARINQNKRTEAFVHQKIAGIVAKSETGLAAAVDNGKLSAEEAGATLQKIYDAAEASRRS